MLFFQDVVSSDEPASGVSLGPPSSQRRHSSSGSGSSQPETRSRRRCVAVDYVTGQRVEAAELQRQGQWRRMRVLADESDQDGSDGDDGEGESDDDDEEEEEDEGDDEDDEDDDDDDDEEEADSDGQSDQSDDEDLAESAWVWTGIACAAVGDVAVADPHQSTVYLS
jgi:hypothetical protein